MTDSLTTLMQHLRFENVFDVHTLCNVADHFLVEKNEDDTKSLLQLIRVSFGTVI